MRGVNKKTFDQIRSVLANWRRSSPLATVTIAVALLLVSATGASAIDVGGEGSGVLTFTNNAMAQNTTHFTTMDMLPEGGGTTWTTAANVDAAVQALTAASISTQLGSSTTFPPSANGIARYNGNASGQFLQTRPTSDAGLVLLAKLSNTSGSTIQFLRINYYLTNFAGDGATELEGQHVYYSTTGNANEWIKIDLFTGQLNGQQTAAVPVSWAAGTAMYVLWADDNGDGFSDASYCIDNLEFVPDTGTIEPPVITRQPVASTNVNQCATLTLSIDTTGTPPLTYQWYRNFVELVGTSRILTIASMQATNDGTYYCVVNGPGGGPVQSDSAVVTFTPDLTAPVLQSAVASANLTNIVLTFSEAMATPSGHLDGLARLLDRSLANDSGRQREWKHHHPHHRSARARRRLHHLPGQFP
jgi:hypothetical protein